MSFAVDGDRQLVTTLCVILVNTDRLSAIHKEISAWSISEDFMEQAGLTVAVRSG